jgi:hypothetical protein
MAQLNARELDKVIEAASILRLEKQHLELPKRESELLQVINRGLEPNKSTRLAQLQDKLREETITPREHAHLLQLTEELEHLAAERLKALIQLAAIRQTSGPKLMKELELTAGSNV